MRLGVECRVRLGGDGRGFVAGADAASGSGGDFAGFGIGRRGGLVGGLGRTPPPCLRLLEPVALAVQLQNMDMMREAIEKRASETLAAEDGGPFLKGKIRRDDGRAVRDAG